MKSKNAMSNLSTSLKQMSPLFLSFFMGAGSLAALQKVSSMEVAKTVDQQAVTQPAIAEELGDLGKITSPFWETSLNQDELFKFADFLTIDQETTPQLTEATPDLILSDFQNRVDGKFAIPDLIFNQTKFWFRIYTEFDSTKKVIHDSLHPHIIYDVVDISEILTLPAKAQWLNVKKAENLVSKRVSEIRQKLKKMAKKNPKNFDEEELRWWQELQSIKGPAKRVITTASLSIRVQTGQKNFFENGLTLSGRYLDGMEKIFESHKLPIELTRLPFVESSFVIGATSKVGAAGIWQFMPGIGRKFLNINDSFDERRNPWKATEAAAKLLKENHQILKRNWGLALTAYNHGPGGVRKAMEVTKSNDIAKIVRSYRSRNFDFASANFYTCFLAALHAQMYKDMIWPDHVAEPALEYETVKVKRSAKVKEILKISGLSDEEFLTFNPELDRALRKDLRVNSGHKLFLPEESAQNFLEKLASVQL